MVGRQRGKTTNKQQNVHLYREHKFKSQLWNLPADPDWTSLWLSLNLSFFIWKVEVAMPTSTEIRRIWWALNPSSETETSQRKEN